MSSRGDVKKIIEETIAEEGAEIVERDHRKNGASWIVIAKGGKTRKVFVPNDIREYQGFIALKTQLRRECRRCTG